ncbi:AEC family transporter [Gimibacter soli]|uniref:AEC family transporter n=1 Tax=Gimibacter soli TaxID=3024400 RepID=A0AAE9XQN0_9PROT|nr:AEC family transporter [Gimibacter soli]WCL54442.1 AEC family transporter [Gimibacter soli]
MAGILTIIAPVFLAMMLGYGLGRRGLFDESVTPALMRYVMLIAVPCLLFHSIAVRPLPGGHEMLMVGGYYGTLALVYIASMFITRFTFGSNLAEQGVFALSVCFANGMFIGYPIIEGQFGVEGVRLYLMILAFHSLTLVTATTLVMERAKAGAVSPAMIRATAISVVSNPILMALGTALVWTGLEIPVPAWLDRLTGLFGASAAPVGLFAGGLSLAGVSIAGDLRPALTATALKLLGLPVAVYAMLHFVLDLPPLWVGVATVMAALPTGIIPYTIAARYQTAPRRTASTVLISTGLSAITLVVLLSLL